LGRGVDLLSDLLDEEFSEGVDRSHQSYEQFACWGLSFVLLDLLDAHLSHDSGVITDLKIANLVKLDTMRLVGNYGIVLE